MRQVFVTGATGFLGTNLVLQLVDRGVEIHALHRETSNLVAFDGLPIHWHLGDVTDKESLAAACLDGVDAFFHAAGDTNTWRLRNARQTRTNVEGTRIAVEVALEKAAARFVHTSSIAAYGIHDGEITEKSPRLGGEVPGNYYRTKYLSEEIVRDAVRERDLPAVILNPCQLVGEWDRNNWSQMILMVKRNTLPGVPPGRGSFCDIAEVARAHVVAAEQGAVGEAYILSGASMTFVEFVRAIGAVVGVETAGSPVPAWVVKTLARAGELASFVTRRKPSPTPEEALMVCDNLRASSEKARRDLGYTSDTDVEAAVRRCYDWMQRNGQLRP